MEQACWDLRRGRKSAVPSPLAAVTCHRRRPADRTTSPVISVLSQSLPLGVALGGGGLHFKHMNQLLLLRSASGFAWGPRDFAGFTAPKALRLSPEKDTPREVLVTWAQGTTTGVPVGQNEGPARSGGGGGSGVGGLSALFSPRPWGLGDAVFSSPVAPVPVWRVTLREQGNKAGIAQAQEKGHKDQQCGECSAGREGNGRPGLLGSLWLQESGHPWLTPGSGTEGGEGTWAQRWKTQREKGPQPEDGVSRVWP